MSLCSSVDFKTPFGCVNFNKSTTSTLLFNQLLLTSSLAAPRPSLTKTSPTKARATEAIASSYETPCLHADCSSESRRSGPGRRQRNRPGELLSKTISCPFGTLFFASSELWFFVRISCCRPAKTVVERRAGRFSCVRIERPAPEETPQRRDMSAQVRGPTYWVRAA